MAVLPVEIVPCIKVPGSSIKIPVQLLESLPPWNNITRSISSSMNNENVIPKEVNWDLGNLSMEDILSLTLNDSGMIIADKKPVVDSIISSPFILTISIASAIGNLIMLCVILCRPRFRKPVNLLIANLSLSCFLFILSSNLRLLENSMDLWTYTTPICQVLAVIHRIPIPIIALTTMTISLDRGRVARNPIRGGSQDFSPIWKIIFIWSFSIIIVMPLGFSRQHDDCMPTLYKCSKVVMFNSPTISIVYGISYLMSVHIIPAVILIHGSIKTLTKMKFLKISGATQNSPVIPSLPDNRVRLLRNSFIFCVIFLAFWLPFGIFLFPLDLPKEIIPEILQSYIHFYFKFIKNITYIQIALNPVILFVLSCDLKKHVSRIDFPI